jgi:hypothetical protein
MNHRHNYSTIICGKCGNRHEIPDNCGNRFCPICSGPRRTRARAKMDAIIAATSPCLGYRWRHLVLTIPSTESPGQMAKDLLHSFRRLRQRVWWKRLVKGGVFVIEVTRTPAGWHVHLHVLMFSRFIFAAVLGRLWRSVSPGYITKIGLAPSGALIRYLTGYLAKSDLSEADQKISSFALKGYRLFGAFGLLNKLALKVKIPPYTCSACGHHGWIHERSRDYVQALKLSGFIFARSGTG